MFAFTSESPKEKLKEFGTLDWIKLNKVKIIMQTLFLIIMGIALKSAFLFILGVLPILSLLTFFVGEAAKIGAALQSSWYLPVLFWQARHESF